MALTHPTGVTAGTLAGPWAYNDFQSLLTGGMTDQPVTLGNNFAVKGTTSLDNGKVFTDGSGNLHINGTLYGYSGILTIGDHLSLDGASITSNGAGKLTVAGLSVNGTVTAQAPVKLAAGYQETGYCGFNGWTSASGQVLGANINYKTMLTNTPTSISLTTFGSGGSATFPPTISGIYTTGFGMYITSTGASTNLYWAGTYATVGNCLRAVDTVAGTFSHHCDHCDALHTDVPLSQMRVETTMGTSLGVVCPGCGTVEWFCTTLTSADEQDTTPQGDGTRGEQAQYIRAAMQHLGLAVQP